MPERPALADLALMAVATGLVLASSATRLAETVLVEVTVSDVMHRAYRRLPPGHSCSRIHERIHQMLPPPAVSGGQSHLWPQPSSGISTRW
jgi:hypothetical protein